MRNSTKKSGLITAPGYPKNLGETLKDELSDLLSYYVDDTNEWQVESIVHALTGVTDGRQWKKERKKAYFGRSL